MRRELMDWAGGGVRRRRVRAAEPGRRYRASTGCIAMFCSLPCGRKSLAPPGFGVNAAGGGRGYPPATTRGARVFPEAPREGAAV